MSLFDLLVLMLLLGVLLLLVPLASAWFGHLLGISRWFVVLLTWGTVAALVLRGLVKEWLNPAVRHERRGDGARRRGRSARAIEEYTAALAAGPEFPAGVHFSRGIVYHDAGQYRRAVADYDQALQINPGIIAAYVYRGRAHQARGEYDRALADFGEAVARSPQYADAYFYRALVREEQGDLSQALADLDQSLSCPGGPAAASYHKAHIHERLGESQEALAAYRGFLKAAARDDPDRARARERIRQMQAK